MLDSIQRIQTDDLIEMIMKKLNESAEKILGKPYDLLDERTQKIVRHIIERKHISKDTAAEAEAVTTFGQKAADAVAKFGGDLDIHNTFWTDSARLGSFELVNSDKV